MGAGPYTRRTPEARAWAMEQIQYPNTVVGADVASILLSQSPVITRQMLEKGEIAGLKMGRNWKVLVQPLRRQLGLDP